MKARDIARKRSKETGNEDDKRIYRKLRNKVTASIKKDRREYYKVQYKECEDNKDTSKLHKIAKTQAGWNKSGPPASLVIGGKKTLLLLVV